MIGLDEIIHMTLQRLVFSFIAFHLARCVCAVVEKKKQDLLVTEGEHEDKNNG